MDSLFNISDNKLFFISNILKKIVTDLNNLSLIQKLPEEFFSTLTGQSEICILDLPREDLEELQLFIVYARLIGGLEISITKSENTYFFININGTYEKHTEYNKEPKKYETYYQSNIEKAINNFQLAEKNYLPLKDKIIHFLNGEIKVIPKDSPGENHKCLIKNFVILTHNRPTDLEKSLTEYIENFKEFGHQEIKIIVSDDSEKPYSDQNKEIINRFNKQYPEIFHLDTEKRNALLEVLTKINFPGIPSDKLEYLIYYTFGGKIFSSTIGRNRNFVSFYLKGHSFITVDDDSRPKVLTYETEILKKAIKRLTLQGNTDLNKLEDYIADSEKNSRQFIHVDFMSHFENSDQTILQYVKYSGAEDGDLSSYILNSFNLIEHTDKKLFPELLKKITYINKQRNPKLQGLCCFFPEDSYKLRVTMPENIRVEDAYIGFNYLLETNSNPLNSNIALYHEKNTDLSEINPNLLHKDIISLIFYYLYRHLIYQHLQEKVNIFEYIKTDIIINSPFWDLFHKEVSDIFIYFRKALELALTRNEIEKAAKLKILIEGLEKEIFSSSKIEYEKKLEKFINRILKNYLNCIKLWIKINSIRSDS